MIFYIIIGWVLCGWALIVFFTYLHYLDGEDLLLEELFGGFFAGFLGPILLIPFVQFLFERYGSKVILKGKKK